MTHAIAEPGATTSVSLREFHPFEAAGTRYVYMVPSAGVFKLDEPSAAMVDALMAGPRMPEDLIADLAGRFTEDRLRETLEELTGIKAIGAADAPREQVVNDLPPEGFPLTTMVLNVTNKCNLACTYCYEYGEDKIVDTNFGDQPKFMLDETARESVEFLLKESGDLPVVHLTFFGGETLLNFPVLQDTVAYARKRGADVGKRIEFSLTTNATLLRPDIIEWLADNEIGVTVSIDGPKEMQDRMRVFHSGRGSYETVQPKIKELLKRHRTRPIGARVTLTRDNLDIHRIYEHLHDDMGFWEIGFAPVTTDANRDYALEDEGLDDMLGQFRELAHEWLEAAVENRHHGFSNVKDTLEEIHKGVSKAYPCGAGLGLMGVSTSGEVSLCHRFAGSDNHGFGTVADGIDREQQREFLEDHHIKNKTDCHTCWARPICSGGCYHESQVRNGSTTGPNLHFCTWVRSWTHTCLEIYGELAERNPAFLARFDA
jgi:uncharacterized protein